MVTFQRPKPQMGTEDDVIFARIAAFVIDAILLVVVLGILSAALSAVSEALASLFGALSIVLWFAYFIYFEAEYGQTIGKMVMDIMVVTERGETLSYGDAAIRNVLRIIDVLPVFYIVGLVAIYLTDKHQRLGDIAADTLVVRARDRGEQL